MDSAPATTTTASTASTRAAAAASRKRRRTPAPPAAPSRSTRQRTESEQGTDAPVQEQHSPQPRQHQEPHQRVAAAADPDSVSDHAEEGAPSRPRGAHGAEPLLQGVAAAEAATPSREAVSEGPLFTVMLNRQLYAVHREDPFLDPRELFLPERSEKIAARPSDAEEARGLHAVADNAQVRHAYGTQPVLLLDCTGAQVLRHRRRRERAAVLQRLERLRAERTELLVVRARWRMRRLRAGRHNTELVVPASEVADCAQAPSATTAAADGAEATVTVSALLDAHVQQARTLRKEIDSCNVRLRELLREKRQCAVTREGCVLLLPSPENGKVRLQPRHHYRTVCFVGEELREVLPPPPHDPLTAAAAAAVEEGGEETAQRAPRTTTAAPHAEDVEEQSERHTAPLPPRDDALSRGAKLLEGATGLAVSAARQRPAWAVEEALAYVAYVCLVYHPRGGGGGGDVAGDAALVPRRLVLRGASQRYAPRIAFDALDDFFAQPASHLAMCREMAVHRYHLAPE